MFFGIHYVYIILSGKAAIYIYITHHSTKLDRHYKFKFLTYIEKNMKESKKI